MGHGQDHPVAEGGQARHYRHLTSLRGLAIAFLLAAAALVARPAAAVAAFYAPRMATILIDARTGAVLEQHNADAPRYPASLTKLMTLYMLFEALRDHRVTLGEQVPVTWHAASMEPVKLYIKPGMRFTVQQAILGMVTLSANDAASAIGQMLGGGSEWRFGQMMTLKAHALGMWHTAYRNASGLPNPAQVTTARDVATLARRLISDFPGDYRYFSTPYFRFNGRTIYTDDVLLKSYPGVDGMKTGYTDAAGHNLVTSALRGGVRLIGVVLDAPSNLARNETMVALLNRGFTEEGVLRGGMVVARAAPL
ncbi:MAG TPA: D-alanyl-D-alanine carboxypeptidase family protein, partial [Acetobacteraceae bacterium]|nr:D-alanyl-D-alanine carboxypeptidase family protein [Acetobacteraceae bacterium]